MAPPLVRLAGDPRLNQSYLGPARSHLASANSPADAHIPNANAFDQAGALRWYKSDVHAVSEREKRGCALPLHFAKVAAEGASEMRDGKVRLPPE